MTLRTVHLHGALKKQFGASYRFDVATASEALKALNCAFPGKFVKALETGSYKLVRGAPRTGMQLDLELIKSLKLGAADLHIIPVAKGAMTSQNAKGTTKVVLGAALIGGAIFMSGGTLAAPLGLLGNAVPGLLGVTYGNIAAVGLGLALAGVSTLLTKPAASATQSDASPTLNDIGNTGTQGAAIQLIYGDVLVGSVPISISSDVEDIAVYSDQQGSIEGAYGHVI
jgi:predicted phage tail protein